MNDQHNNTPDASDAGPLLTAHALNELSEREQGQVEQLLASDPQAGQTVEEVKRLATALRETCVEPAAPPVVALREAVVARLDELEAAEAQVTLAKPAESVWRRRRAWSIGAAALGLLGGVVAFWTVVAATDNNWRFVGMGYRASAPEEARKMGDVFSDQDGRVKRLKSSIDSAPDRSNPHFAHADTPDDEIGANSARGTTEALTTAPVMRDASPRSVQLPDFGERTAPKNDLGKTIGAYPGPGIEGRGDKTHSAVAGSTSGSGAGRPSSASERYGHEFSSNTDIRAKPSFQHAPFQPAHSVKPNGQGGIGGVTGTGPQPGGGGTGYGGPSGGGPGGGQVILNPGPGVGGPGPGVTGPTYAPGSGYPGAPGIAVPNDGKYGDGYRFVKPDTRDAVAHGEQYEAPPENAFLPVDKATALSTFSIDVDTASYANVRRFLSQNQLPPPHAVRIEEMLNYFRYTYPQPQGEDPFSVSMELADCPWQPGHELLRIALKGKEVEAKARKAGNLVFLVDVSGSMQPENKLPLLKQALKMLTGELTENDTVTIVTYAGDAGLKLDATNGTRQNEIRAAIDSLTAGGSTHGSAGIELAYQQAAKSFIKGGTNRVILATDGDLNVGITSDDALVDLIKTKAAGGVFLTVLGVGEGNLKDAKMEKLADNGNGVYAYLDTLREARKVLVEQLAGSLETIAKDVKLQIEFNPAEVQAYRLIGYENRVLATRDFHDDKKDAGEIGAGHTVTALYELVPARAKAAAKAEARGEGEPLKYQKTPEVKPAPEALTPAAGNGEVLTLKLRFKQPDAETSKLREFPLKNEAARFSRASADFQFAAAVASFGMLLKNSQHRGDATFSAVEEIAAGSIGPDASGYRAEFLDLVRKAKTLK